MGRQSELQFSCLPTSKMNSVVIYTSSVEYDQNLSENNIF